jgi:hypothetical protein
MDQIFPGTEKYQHRHVRRGAHGFERSWSKGEADIKVKCACERCNSGWMDRLDHEAEDVFLTHAAIGYPVTLSRTEDQQTVARWCSLIAALVDQTQAHPTVEPATHEAVYHGEVPARTLIWLLRTEPPPFTVTAWAEPRGWQMASGSNPPRDAYFITFGVSHLVAQVFIPTERTPQAIEFDRTANAPILRQLWPRPLTPLRWPPPQTIPWAQLPELAEAFQRPSE